MKKIEEEMLRNKLDLAVLEENVGLLKAFFSEEKITEDILLFAEDTMIGAIVNGNLEIVKFLLAHGVSPNAKDKKGELFALNYAAHWCRPEITQLLLDAGANINARDSIDGNTAIFTAFFKKNECPQLLNILLSNGADPNIVNFHGNSAASLATRLEVDLKEYS